MSLVQQGSFSSDSSSHSREASSDEAVMTTGCGVCGDHHRRHRSRSRDDAEMTTGCRACTERHRSRSREREEEMMTTGARSRSGSKKKRRSRSRSLRRAAGKLARKFHNRKKRSSSSSGGSTTSGGSSVSQDDVPLTTTGNRSRSSSSSSASDEKRRRRKKAVKRGAKKVVKEAVKVAPVLLLEPVRFSKLGTPLPEMEAIGTPVGTTTRTTKLGTPLPAMEDIVPLGEKEVPLVRNWWDKGPAQSTATTTTLKLDDLVPLPPLSPPTKAEYESLTKREKPSLAFAGLRPMTPADRLAARSAPQVSNAMVERLARQADFMERLPMGMATLMKTGASPLAQSMPLGKKHHDGESMKKMLRHIKERHAHFYGLLDEANLIDTLKKRHDVVIVVPGGGEAMDTEAVRYHLVVSAVPLHKMSGMVALRTLRDGAEVQVEERVECEGHFINGQRLQPDHFFPTRIYHVRQPLSETQLAPADAADATQEEATSSSSSDEKAAATQEESSESTGSEEDLPPPMDAPPAWREEMTSERLVLAGRPVLAAVHKRGVYANAQLGKAIGSMNSLCYNARTDLGQFVERSASEAHELVLRLYDTNGLFGEYQRDAMRDISRLACAREARFVVEPEKQLCLRLGDDAFYRQYECAGAALKKADLLAGLVEVSFPTAAGRAVLLCALHCVEGDEHTYASADRTLLLRMKDNQLAHLLVNERATLAPAESALAPHCVELTLTSELATRLRPLDAPLDIDAFNALLATEADVKRYLRKKTKGVRKAAGKAARKLHAKGKRQGKKLAAARSYNVASGETATLVAALAAQEAELTATEEQLTLTVFDAKMVANQRASRVVTAEKYAYDLEGEQADGWVLGANSLAGQLGQSNAQGHFLRVATPFATVTFNLSRVSTSSAIYAEHDGMVYVLLFSGGQLTRLVALPNSSRQAHDVKSARSFAKKASRRHQNK